MVGRVGVDVSRDGGCEAACPLSEAMQRRDFLRDAVSRALVAIGALAIGSARASAMTIAFASGAPVSRSQMIAVSL